MVDATFPKSNSQSDNSSALAELILVGPPKLDVFRGDPREWIPFITGFESTIASKTTNNSLKLAKLWEHLDQSVRSVVVNYKMDQVNGYDKAVRALWEQFGHPATIAAAVRDHLISENDYIRIDDYVGLKRFAAAIENALNCLRVVQERYTDISGGYNYLSSLDNPDTLVKLLSRIPQQLQREFVATLGGHPGDVQRLHEYLKNKTASNSHHLLQELSKINQRNVPPIRPQTPRPGLREKFLQPKRATRLIVRAQTRRTLHQLQRSTRKVVRSVQRTTPFGIARSFEVFLSRKDGKRSGRSEDVLRA